MSDKQVITVPGFKGLGPYSMAVRSAGLLFVSGQPGINSTTGETVGTTFEAQARQAFKNLEAVLKAGGSDLSLVVNTTVSIADMSFFPELNKLYLEFFPENPPARMAMQVPLPKGLLISIGCVAAVKD